MGDHLTAAGLVDAALDAAAADSAGWLLPVEPLLHMSQEVNELREDVAYNAITHEEALRNAPRKDSDYYRVPKVLE